MLGIREQEDFEACGSSGPLMEDRFSSRPPGWKDDLELLQAENAQLRERLLKESRFRELAESIPQLVWTCQPDGWCDYLGPQWVAYTGIPEADQIGYGWLECLHPDDRARVSLEWRRCADAQVPMDVDFRIRKVDGSYRWFKTRAVPTFDSNGQMVRWLGTNTDIQELRNKEAELERLRDGLEREVAARTDELARLSDRLVRATTGAHVGIWDWNVVGDFLVWDDNMYALYGLERTGPHDASPSWRASLHPDDFDAAQAAVMRALSGEQEFDTRFRILTPNGGTRYIHGIATVERAPDGTPLRMLGVNRDVTAEELAHQKLKEAEERWNFALEGTGDGVWDWKPKTGELFLSARSRELFGYQPSGVITANDRINSVHPADRTRLQSDMECHLRGETPGFSVEYRALRGNGEYVWVHGRGRVMARGEDGAPERVVGTYKDITERRRAQAALEQREALLRQFIAHTPAAIAVMDSQMRYVQVSHRWLTDYKLSGQDVIGRSHYEVFPDVPERWKQIHQRVLAGAIESCEDDPFPRADGGLERLQWEARPWFDADGAIGGLIFFTQVITARKKLELNLAERNEQLSRSNTELEQFAYVASHDLQEPLRAVAGCTQLLQQRCKHKLDPDDEVLMQHIVEGANRMKALIEGLLQLSRVNALTSRAWVESQEALDQALSNLKASLTKCGAQIVAEELPTVHADRTHLVQLFQNLIGNALKYRSPSIPVHVSISARTVPGGRQFSICDNGIGIAPEYHERIFGIFQRLHTRNEYPGTGIGLAICRKIVDRHGGNIWVESSPAAGATFHFTLMD